MLLSVCLVVCVLGPVAIIMLRKCFLGNESYLAQPFPVNRGYSCPSANNQLVNGKIKDQKYYNKNCDPLNTQQTFGGNYEVANPLLDRSIV